MPFLKSNALPPGVRPEAMRSRAVAENALVLIGASLLALAFSIGLTLAGQPAAMIIALVGLCAGGFSHAARLSARIDLAAVIQVFGIGAAGAIATVLDPAPADVGLAIAVLAPVLASLLGNRRLRHASWALLALTLAGGIGLGLLDWPRVVDRNLLAAFGAGVFAVIAIMIARTASLISRAFEVGETAQINAYRHLLETVEDAVMRFSEDGQLLHASRSSERLFGCHRYELLDERFSLRVHVADRPAFLNAFADANEGRHARSVEVRVRRNDPEARGGYRFVWAEIRLSAVSASRPGRTRHEVIGLMRDVSERKAHEDQISAARLEAEEASQAKSRFLATVGHELRTPLNAVIGLSDMMRHGIGGELNATHREYTDMIASSAQHLLGVMGMLLDMSRIEAGKFELSPEEIAPEALVDPCLRIVETLAASRRIAIVSEIASPMPLVRVDERASRQIVLNLLSNAIKFSHDGGTVRIALKRQGQSLNISVSDTGIGMDEAALERIGEPFFQAESGLDRRYEGTGLGLSIVKGLVELHEGSLRAVSEPGLGTTMTVLLPLNGPAIKLGDTAPLAISRPAPQGSGTSAWQDAKRRAL